MTSTSNRSLPPIDTPVPSVSSANPFFQAHENTTLREILTHFQASVANSLTVNDGSLHQPCKLQLSLTCNSNTAGKINCVEIKITHSVLDNPLPQATSAPSNPIPLPQHLNPDIMSRTRIHPIIRTESLESPGSSLTPGSRERSYIELPKENRSRIHKLTFGCTLSDTYESLSIKISELTLNSPSTAPVPSSSLISENSNNPSHIEFNYKSKRAEDLTTDTSSRSEKIFLGDIPVRQSVRLNLPLP